MRVILASKSPRRRELLSKLFENFEIMSFDADESLPKGESPSHSAEIIAIRKGEAVLNNAGNDALVISSDTMVEIDGIILGKPVSSEDARRMLKMLSGREHNVHTGVAVHYNGKVFSGVDTTRVKFREIKDEEIEAYILTGEPMDKAGAYGIQGGGGDFVLNYEGHYDTVVGLSLILTKKLIEEVLII